MTTPSAQSWIEDGDTHLLAKNQNYSIRETAVILGIGRARVVQLEKKILGKLRDFFAGLNVCSFGDLESIPDSVFLRKLEELSKSIDPPPFQAKYGWVRVQSVVSLNKGTTRVDSVLQTYNYLKPKYENLLRPKVFERHQQTPSYIISALGLFEGQFLARIRPTTSGPSRKVNYESITLRIYTCSIFANDHFGDFDVPIIDAALIV